MREIILTHCGKLGDFLYSLQIAAWLHRERELKIHWVLPKCFEPFNYLTPLLMKQPFTSGVMLVDHQVRGYDCGGQPYRFDPRDMPFEDECNEYRYEARVPTLPYFNLGFRGYPDKYVSAYYAEEHGFGYDPGYRIKIWDDGPGFIWGASGAPTDQNAPFIACYPTDEILRSRETPMAGFVPHAAPMGAHEDLLHLARQMKAAREVHTWFCGLAILCAMSGIKVTVHRVPGHAYIPLYYEGDYGHVTFVEHEAP